MENNYIIELVLRQMVVIEKFIDQAMVFSGKILLFLCQRYFTQHKFSSVLNKKGIPPTYAGGVP